MEPAPPAAPAELGEERRAGGCIAARKRHAQRLRIGTDRMCNLLAHPPNGEVALSGFR